MTSTFCCSSVRPTTHTLSPYSHCFATFLTWANIHLSPQPAPPPPGEPPASTSTATQITTNSTASSTPINLNSPLTYVIRVIEHSNALQPSRSAIFVSKQTSDGRTTYAALSPEVAEAVYLRERGVHETVYCAVHERRFELRLSTISGIGLGEGGDWIEHSGKSAGREVENGMGGLE